MQVDANCGPMLGWVDAGGGLPQGLNAQSVLCLHGGFPCNKPLYYERCCFPLECVVWRTYGKSCPCITAWLT